MNYILEFYKGLDTVNLIIFWGVIIVVLLLLIFSIIIVNKNKKLERIIEAKGINVDDDLAIKKVDHEEPIIREKTIPVKEEPIVVKEPEIPVKQDIEIPIVKEEPVKEEKFVAEEHVMEYNTDFFEIPTIKKQSEVEEEPLPIIKEEPVVEEKKIEIHNEIPAGPYQRNILREVYPSQTSPIGNVNRETNVKTEVEKAAELNEVLNTENNVPPVREEVHREPEINRYQRNAPVYQEVQRKGNYLEELSKKMSENRNDNNVDRTSYELEQEQNAIISYEELMQKKDHIKMVDEEDAVISIEELKRRKEDEKLYNITEKEPNDDFINELKNFRSDL